MTIFGTPRCVSSECLPSVLRVTHGECISPARLSPTEIKRYSQSRFGGKQGALTIYTDNPEIVVAK